LRPSLSRFPVVSDVGEVTYRSLSPYSDVEKEV